MRLLAGALSLAIGSLMLWLPPAWPQDAQVTTAHRAYVERCTPNLSTQGMPPDKATSVCECAASRIEAEVKFGTAGDRERYDMLMQAQPDPNGSADDRQLYSILAPCFARTGSSAH